MKERNLTENVCSIVGRVVSTLEQKKVEKLIVKENFLNFLACVRWYPA